MGGVVSGPVADADEFVMLVETTRRGRGRDHDLLLWVVGGDVRAYVLIIVAYSTVLVEPNRRGRTRRCLS